MRDASSEFADMDYQARHRHETIEISSTESSENGGVGEYCDSLRRICPSWWSLRSYRPIMSWVFSYIRPRRTWSKGSIGLQTSSKNARSR